MVKRLFGRRSSAPEAEAQGLEAASKRAEKLVEESREHVVVLDADRKVLAASRRARQSLEGVVVGELLPERLLEASEGRDPLEIEYEVDGVCRDARLPRHSRRPRRLPGASRRLHGRRIARAAHPLARLMVLLDSLALPGADADALAAQARAEVEQIGELIDDVLFLSELESGRAVVSLGSTPALPVLEEIVAARAERSANAGVALHVDCPAELEVPLRPRMLETIAANLVDNAATRVQVQRSRFARTRRVTRSYCQAWTAGTACRTKTCRACSSASSAPTARVPRTAPASASPSSSTSSPRQAARPRRERCRAAASRSAASSQRQL